MVAFFDARHAAPDIDDDAGTLMAEDRRKQPFRIAAGQCELVGVADPGRLDLDQHLAVFGTIELNLLDRERLSGLESDSSACLHDLLPGFGLMRPILAQPGLSHCPLPPTRAGASGWNTCLRRPRMGINRTTTVKLVPGRKMRLPVSYLGLGILLPFFAIAPPRLPMSRPARPSLKNARSAIPPRPGRTRSGRACLALSAANLRAWTISITPKP